MALKADSFKKQREILHSPHDASKRKCCSVYCQCDKKLGTARVRGDLAGLVGTLTKPPWDTGTDTKDSLGTFRQGAKPQR